MNLYDKTGRPIRTHQPDSLTRRSLIGVIVFALGVLTAVLVRGEERELLLFSPADDLRACVEDLEQRVPVELRPSTRYLSLSSIPREQWDSANRALSFVLNSVSHTDLMQFPETVPGTFGRIVRVNLWKFDPKNAVWLTAWEKAVAKDRYWHQAVDVIIEKKRSGGEVRQALVAPDIFAGDAARALKMTGSHGIVLRIDHFLAVATTTEDGGVYYDFAGIGDKRDWHKLLGIDQDVIVAVKANRGANLFESAITDDLRRLSRKPGPLGAEWITYDSANPTPAADPFYNPTFTMQFEVSEAIAAKGNGLHLFALFDNRGKRQDAAPSAIAIDDTVHPPVELRPMISCLRCHARNGDSGLRSFVDKQSRLLAGRPDLDGDPATIEQLVAFYSRQDRLEKDLERDREDYREAVKKCTDGWTVKQTADAVASIVADYQDLVTVETAAREAGTDVETLQRSLRPTGHSTLIALADGFAVQRRQWEEAFQAALAAIEQERAK